jgi:hypothetical protein
MWKLKIGAETDRGDGGGGGSERWLRSLNNHLGRQVWEFHPDLGTQEEHQQIDDARRDFWERRFEKRHSSDLLMRIQVHPQSQTLEFFVVLVWFYDLGSVIKKRKQSMRSKLGFYFLFFSFWFNLI